MTRERGGYLFMALHKAEKISHKRGPSKNKRIAGMEHTSIIHLFRHFTAHLLTICSWLSLDEIAHCLLTLGVAASVAATSYISLPTISLCQFY